ncbi:pyridoxamine kinase [Lipomyces arxii]|uniref:pyridoxamine kinase n=1 Tax=Lipomyces arxii TaxID=56418 RepID=UPI0034CEC20C
MTCITALTAQNTTGVKDIYAVTDVKFIETVLDAVFADVGVDAVKTGMLASANTVKTIATCLRKYEAVNVIVDPVMVSTSGSVLLPEEAVSTYLTDLFPISTMITPNLQEAQFLYKIANGTDFTVDNLEDLKLLAKELYNFGPKYVLVKGGHLPLTTDYTRDTSPSASTILVDVLYDGSDYVVVESSFVVTKNTHGTGCTLSSAIASNFAKGMTPVDSVKRAIEYVHYAISDNLELGHGNGPINHLHVL